MSQLTILPKIDPDELVAEVVGEHRPLAVVALCSGGRDSTVLAHRCRDHFSELAYIDTGTALPGVREFVIEFAEWLGKPLRVLESGSAYRDMILGRDGGCPKCAGTGREFGDGEKLETWSSLALPRGYCVACRGTGRTKALGFPGPAQHNRAYNRLKERQLRVLRRDLQAGRRGRVVFLSGIRRGESARRKSRAPITREGSTVFANPLIDWTNEDCRAYMTTHEVPESPVAALLHKSGECNCGSFAAPGEREMIEALYPEWWEAVIDPLEAEARARPDIHADRWGERPGEPTAAGPLCTDCELRLFA